MSWQTIEASETDANSPLNQTLMDKLRGNDADNHGKMDATTGHKHTGAADDAPPVDKVAAVVAGDGLSETSGVLAVRVDGVGIEIGGDDILNLKANGVRALEIANDAVGSSQIKYLLPAAASGTGNHTMTGGTVCHYPQVKTGGAGTITAQLANAAANTSYLTNIHLNVSISGSAQWWYVGAGV